MSHYDGDLRQYLEKFNKEGKQYGVKDEPKLTGYYPDEREAKAQLLANQRITVEKQLFNRAVKTFNDGISSIDKRVSSAETFLEHFTESNSIKHEIEIEIEKALPIQSKLILTRKQWQRSLHKFQDDNDIHTPPISPGSILFGVGIIMLCACAEIGLNAFFFAESQGLAFALMIAIGLSAISMGSASILGIFWRFKNLKGNTNKFIGWGAFVLAGILIIFMNALFAKFRTLYKDGDESVFLSAFHQAQGIFLGNYTFDDLQSYELFGIGVLLMGFAFYKGYQLFPKYPGYIEINEKLEEAIAEENFNAEKLRSKISELYGKNIQELKQAIELPNTAKKNLIDSSSNLNLAFKNYLSSLDAIHGDFALLVGQYRQANKAVPGRTRVPDYFDEEVPKLFSIDNDNQILEDKLNEKESLINRINKLVENPERLISQERNLKDEMVSILRIEYAQFKNAAEDEADKLSSLRTPF